MSKNDQTVTARVNNKWYCWSVTAESCDDMPEVLLSIDDSLARCGRTKREALRRIEDVFEPSEYGNYEAENGWTYLAKDGKPVRILELTQEKTTRSKKEQVRDDNKRIKALEKKVDTLSQIVLSLVSTRQTFQRLLENLADNMTDACDILTSTINSVEFERMSYNMDKKKALDEFFELDKE